MKCSSFKIPQEIIYGWGSLDYLGCIKGGKAIVFTDRSSMEKWGFLDKTLKKLKQTGVNSFIIRNVEKEPSFKEVLDNLEEVRSFAPDVFIALGGGSVIDVAKVIKILYEVPTLSFDNLFTYPCIPPLSGKSYLIAIPSTSGTGSEVTCAAVFIEPTSRLKQVMIFPELIPDIAVLDPEITLSLPPHITAYSGLDALTHAVESYICKISTEFTRAYALQAIKLIFSFLPIAFADGKNKEAREKMHFAATLAGLAISNSSTTLAHSLDQIGPLFGLAHGQVVAMLFPYVLEYNRNYCESSYVELAQNLKILADSKEQLADKFIQKVRKLIVSVGIPLKIADAGIEFSELEENMETIIPLAMEAFATKQNPRIPSSEEIRKIIIYAYYGRDIDF